MINRRSFLKAAPAAAGVAIATPRILSSAPAPTLDYAVGEIGAALKIDESWTWWGSGDGEVFSSGPFSTREEAIEATISDYPDGSRGQICEAIQGVPRLSISFDDIEQIWSGQNEDGFGEDGYDGPSSLFAGKITDDIESDLEKRIAAAVDDWILAHELTPRLWAFDAVRNSEAVAIELFPDPDPSLLDPPAAPRPIEISIAADGAIADLSAPTLNALVEASKADVREMSRDQIDAMTQEQGESLARNDRRGERQARPIEPT